MNQPSEKLVSDVKVLASDVEELLKATVVQSAEKVAATRGRVEAGVKNAAIAIRHP